MNTFETAFAAAEPVEGWLSEAQAKRLWDAASRLSTGSLVVEIGSFRGRSAIVLASALDGCGSVVAIDPHMGSDRGPQEIEPEAQRGDADNAAFRANLERAGVAGSVRHVRAMSSDALGEVESQIDLLYVDGAHRYGPARDDLVSWGARVRPGGTMLVHDSFSSIGVTLASLTSIAFGGDWRYVGRTATLAEYRRERLGVGARLANAVRQIVQLPWFAWNVLLKVLTVLRIRRGPWPY